MPGPNKQIIIIGGGSGSGDVVGPASSTDNAIARFNGTTGKIIQNSSATIADDGTLIATSVSAGASAFTGINVNGTGGNGHVHLKHQSADPTSQASSTTIFADSNGNPAWINDGLSKVTLDGDGITANRSYTLPDASGTVALTSDLSSYQPLDSDLTAIAGLTPSNDDIIQRKAGVWTNRTPGQVKTDLAISTGDVSGLQEYVEDTIGTKVVAGTNVTVSYNDTTGETTINSTSGSGTPGGTDTQVQFNDGGAFGGDSRFYFDKSTGGVTGGDFGVAAGASTDGYGGELYAEGGRAGRGGGVQAFAGNAIGIDADGGDLYFSSGSGNGTGIGGRVYFQGGGAGVGGVGGDIEFQIGNADTPGKYLFRTASTSFAGELNFESLTANRVATLQDADGTLAYLSDIPAGYTDEQAQDAVGTILTDSAEIDFTYNDATPSITASIIAGSIDETKLDASVNASLDLADSAVQPAGLTNYFLKTADDTDDITVGATNKFATSAEKTKLGFISVTQAVDLDTIESDTATNNAKVSNATHTGEVTGSTTLTVDPTAISNKTAKTSLAGTEEFLINDGGTLKKVTASNLPSGGGGGISDGDKGDITVSSSGTVWTIDEPALRKSETSVNNSPTFTTINKFDTLQTNFYGNGTVALETTLEAEGTGAMKLTLATAGVCGPRLTLASTTNFLKKAFTIKCRASAWANISTAEILFATEAGFTNYYLWQWKGSTNGKLVTPPDNEWIERVFNPGDCAVGSGTPNWGAITHIIIRAQASSGTPDFYVDDFKYFGCTQIPTICVTYDDSLSTQFSNGKAKLDQYDIKGTFYCIWDLIGSSGTYLTQAEVDTLSVQGHDISGHGQTNLTTLSSAQQITDLIGMKKWLVTNGYRGANNYALPNGAYTDAVLANVRKYFNSIANIDWLSNSKEYSPNYLINRFSPDSGTSTATIQAWIDNAIANNNMAIIAWHGIVASGATGAQVTQATYDTIMDYIGTKKASGEIQTATLTDYYATDVDENPVRLLAIADPSTPPAGVGYLYSKSIAGRVVPKFKGPTGLDYPLQSSFWQNNITMWNPTTATAGVWLGTAGADAGTYSTALPTNTNLYTSMKRARWANVVTTTNQVLGQRNTEAMYFRGDTTSGAGGFFFYTRCGFDVWTNGGRFFAGMHSGTTVVSADPSALNNTVGFCVDAADNGAISFLTRGTSATKASTGFTITSNKGYDLYIFCVPGSSQYTWRIVDIVAGTEASGTATATLPTNNTKLTAGVLASNAALTPVTSIQLGVNKIYIETDY